MLDYRGVEALYTVMEEQSFEAAAKKLHITQSAVSQRIKGLESFYGEPVLIRVLPYKPTELGSSLLAHFKRVSLLEDSLKQQIEKAAIKPRISIALNRDSMETWFLDLLDKKHIFDHLTLEIIADDQELTLDYFKKGLVSACLSVSDKAIMGANVAYLGKMDYLLVATRGFIDKHFSENNPKKCLLNAPAVIFDKNDKLLDRYLERFFQLKREDLTFQIMPSIRGFKKVILLGYAYGLIPKIDILKELKKKELIQIFPDKIWEIPLYWHYLDIESKFYKKFTSDIIEQARHHLT